MVEIACCAAVLRRSLLVGLNPWEPVPGQEPPVYVGHRHFPTLPPTVPATYEELMLQ
jgi:hypothetical protein